MKRMVFYIIVIACLFIIKDLIVSIYEVWRKQDLLVAAKKDLEAEKQRNNQLKAQISIVESEFYIEEQARNKLFMLRPNEQEILVSRNLFTASGSAHTQEQAGEPNWRKWWRLFFY